MKDNEFIRIQKLAGLPVDETSVPLTENKKPTRKISLQESKLRTKIREMAIAKLSEMGEFEDEAWEKAYDEHINSLKTFVNDVLEVPYDVNIGWGDGNEENIIYITSKIYGENPTTFTTHHKETTGDQIDYEYKSYKPISASPDEIEDALKKRLNENQSNISVGDTFIVTKDMVTDNGDEEMAIAYEGDVLKAIEDDGDGAFLFEMIEGFMEGIELSLNSEEISKYLNPQDSLDEAEEEEIELNDAPEEGEGEETTDEFDSEEDSDTGGEPSGNIKGIQDSLEAALAAAREIGDEKLVDQIGNTITFFTRTHVVKERKGLNEEFKRMQKLAGIIKG